MSTSRPLFKMSVASCLSSSPLVFSFASPVQSRLSFQLSVYLSVSQRVSRRSLLFFFSAGVTGRVNER